MQKITAIWTDEPRLLGKVVADKDGKSHTAHDDKGNPIGIYTDRTEAIAAVIVAGLKKGSS